MTPLFSTAILLPSGSMRFWRIVVVSVRVSRQGGRRDLKEGILGEFLIWSRRGRKADLEAKVVGGGGSRSEIEGPVVAT